VATTNQKEICPLGDPDTLQANALLKINNLFQSSDGEEADDTHQS